MSVLYEDYLKLRELKDGETLICSDGVERGRIESEKFTSCSVKDQLSYIPYGVNDTADNR